MNFDLIYQHSSLHSLFYNAHPAAILHNHMLSSELDQYSDEKFLQTLYRWEDMDRCRTLFWLQYYTALASWSS